MTGRAAHVVLVGLPGSGKTTVGRLLADRLGRQFVDLDEAIEQGAGMPISRIFAELGESTFRQLERQMTLELRDSGAMVISPGGGWITNPSTVALLRPPATIIYMKTSPEAAFGRLGAGLALRPLVAGGDGLERMRELYRERRAAYEAADVTVDTENLSPQEVTEKLVTLVVSLEARG